MSSFKFSASDIKCLVLNRAEWRDGQRFVSAEAALKFLGTEAFEILKNHEVYKKGPFPGTYYPDGVMYIAEKHGREYEYVGDEHGYRFVPVASPGPITGV